MANGFASALMESVSPTTNIFCVGTALHPKDTLQCLKTAPGWNHKTFRALIQEPLRLDLWVSGDVAPSFAMFLR